MWIMHIMKKICTYAENCNACADIRTKLHNPHTRHACPPLTPALMFLALPDYEMLN